MKIDMYEIAGSKVLSGSVNGKSVFSGLLSSIECEAVEPTLVFLDFAQIEFASGSFLRESVFEFKKYVRSSYVSLYPLVANINRDISEDLVLLANAKKDVLMSCQLDESGKTSNPVLLGSLDPKQGMTLKLVEALGHTDANSLMKSYGKSENTKSTTAWNNRLSGLATRGLVREFSNGRAKTYRPLLTGDSDGS